MSTLNYAIHVIKGNQERGGFDAKNWKKDPRDLDLEVLGGWFGYTPKQTRKIIQTLTVKDQGQLNTCVIESVSVQKEKDEQVPLSVQSLAAYMRQKKDLNSSGSSLNAGQEGVSKFGIAEESLTDNKRSSFETFTRPSVLTQEVLDNASKHKSKSYWTASTLETVLQQLDEDRIGATALMWYSGYNMGGGLTSPWIITPFKGSPIFGHAVVIIGYDLDYQGQKVLVLQNSYGKQWGDQGKFYIKFDDFARVCVYGTKFNLDLDKDLLSWLSQNASYAIKEVDSPKIYIIESDRKRWIPDEAMFQMLELTFSNVRVDTDHMLNLVKEGEPMSMNDIPAHKLNNIKQFIQLSKNQEFIKSRFQPYFPEIF